MAEETNQNQAGDVASNPAATAPEKPPAETKAAKKEKPPALEDKPFEEFMQQHYLPALQEAITKEGVPDVNLTFAKQKYSIIGFVELYCVNFTWWVYGVRACNRADNFLRFRL